MTVQTKVEAATLASAMAAAFGEIEAATKSANNPHFKTKYADITAVIEAIKPALIKHGLFFTQHPIPSENGITVETHLHHAGGEHMTLGSLFVPANKNDAQGFGSALTYARRYALVTAFGVPVEDDDGTAAARGQSQAGAVSPSQPIAKRERLAGPYHSKTALQTAVKGFVREMQGTGDWDEWCVFRDMKETRELLEQVQRDMPQWWDGGPDMPEEFVPLRRQVEIHEANMAQAIADVARA